MDSEAPSVDDRAPVAVCPFEVLSEMLETFAESTRIFADGLGDSSALPASLGRSLSSVIEANGALFEQLSDVARRFEPSRAPAAGSETARPRRAASSTGRSADGAQPVLLTGRPGEEAAGAFVLQNLRPEPTRATVLATSFVDLAGDHAELSLKLEPNRVVLEPGEEVVVRVAAVIPSDLIADQQLQGAIHVPGLSASVVPVIVRAAVSADQ